MVIAFVAVGAIVSVAVAESAHSGFDSDVAEADAAFVAGSRSGASSSPAGVVLVVLFAGPESKPGESALRSESVAESCLPGRRRPLSTAARSAFRQVSVTESLLSTSVVPTAIEGLLRHAPLAVRH